jgi:hypothetical protein
LSGVTNVPSTSARNSRMAVSIGFLLPVETSTGLPGAVGQQVKPTGP